MKVTYIQHIVFVASIGEQIIGIYETEELAWNSIQDWMDNHGATTQCSLKGEVHSYEVQS